MNQLPPIIKLAERLLVDIEQAVRGFARYHKYAVGADLRKQAMTVMRMCHRAWRDRQQLSYWLDKLVWAIDELKLSMQLGSQVHAFGSFRQFELLVRQAEELGRQAGGWKRQHLKSQNPRCEVAGERTQILSGPAASTYTGAKP